MFKSVASVYEGKTNKALQFRPKKRFQLSPILAYTIKNLKKKTVKADPEEPGSEGVCPPACNYITKEVHYHCRMVSWIDR